MNIFIELVIRGVLVIALNDGIIFYVVKKRAIPLTIPLIASIILVTCIALVINIWFCLHQNGII
ncbi:MAG: hypothetical protein L6276_11835 [Acetobacterium sp.]|nr:hypothetical protein [Bacillota bacterium]MCG2730944.1 hypothetical protein [Acetobacterium sp.]